LHLPIAKRPTLLLLPVFKPPAHIDKRPYEKGIEVTGMYYAWLGRESVEEVHREFGLVNITETVTFRGSKGGFNFARLLAKIAYGFAVAQYGIENIDDAYLLPSILGTKDDIGRWVGCASDTELITEPHLHQITLWLDHDEIHASIRLFASLNTPKYLVIVGHIAAHADCE